MFVIFHPRGILFLVHRRGFHGSDDSSDFSDNHDEVASIDNWHMALAKHRRLLSGEASKENFMPRRAKTPGPGNHKKGNRKNHSFDVINNNVRPNSSVIANTAEQPSSLLPPVDLVRQNLVNLQQINGFLERAGENAHSLYLAGKFLFCRSIAPSYENRDRGDVNLLVDDEDGQLAAPVRLLNFGVDLPGSGFPCNSLQRSIPVGTIIALMNPNVHRDEQGNMVLRCQNPAQFAVLGPEHPLIRDATLNNFRARLPYPCEVNLMPQFVDLNKAGEKYVRDRNYTMALFCFNRVIERQGDDVSLAYANRADVFMSMGSFEMALEDAEHGLDLDPANPELVEQLRLVKTRSLFSLKNYQQCADFLEENPVSDESLKVAIENAIQESQFGCFDLAKMRQEVETNNSPYLIDHADYFAEDLVDPVGFTAKADIEPGTLLMANRAIAFHASGSLSGREVVSIVFARLSANPEATKAELSKMVPLPTSFDDALQLAGFIEDEALLAVDYFSPVKNCIKGCGLWPSPPNRLKVSCGKANVARSFIGDFVFVHSIKTISNGEQLATFIPTLERLPSPFSFTRDACDCDLCSMDRDESSEQCRLKFAQAESALQTQMELLTTADRPTKAKLENGIENLVVALKGLKKNVSGQQQRSDRSTAVLVAKMRSCIGQLHAKLRDYKMATAYMEEAARGYDEMGPILPESLRCADMLADWFSQIPGNRGVRKSAEWKQRKTEYAQLLCGGL